MSGPGAEAHLRVMRTVSRAICQAISCRYLKSVPWNPDQQAASSNSAFQGAVSACAEQGQTAQVPAPFLVDPQTL